MRARLAACLLFAAALGFTLPAHAEDMQPGDSCAGFVAGDYRPTGGRNNPDGALVVCDGSIWQPILRYSSVGNAVMFSSTGLPAAPLHVWGEAIIGSNGLACASSTEGALRYSSASNLWEYCDGASWKGLASGSGGSAAAGTDRGIQFNSGGSFGADANFVLDASGNLGIGTPTPAVGLDVVGIMRAIDDAAGCTATERGAIRFNSAGAVMELCDGAAWLDLASGSGVGAAAGSDRQIQFNSGGAFWADTNFVFNSAGQLGIGTAAPSSALHIEGNSPYLITLSNSAASGDFIDMLNNSGNRVISLNALASGEALIRTAWNTTGNDAIRIDSWQDVSGSLYPRIISYNSGGAFGYSIKTWDYGSEIQLADQEGSGSLIFQKFNDLFCDSCARIWNEDSSDLVFYMGPSGSQTESMRLTNAGKLGIGTTSPVVPLDVAGIMRAIDDAAGCTATERGAIRFNSAGGALELCDGSAWSGVGGGGGALDDLSDAITYSSSVFLGSGAGVNDDGTNANLAVGINVLNANTTGDLNIALGNNALLFNFTGSQNIAIGHSALKNNSTANNNIAIGASAMSDNDTGFNNTAIGVAALLKSTNGAYNTVLGTAALIDATGASYNVAVGDSALGNAESANSNVAVGYRAGGGDNFSATGSLSGNTIIGYSAGAEMDNGSSNNILIGYQAGDVITTGDNNIIIGYDVDPSSATASNELNIGDTIFGDLSTGNVGIGDSTPDHMLDVGGNVGITAGGYLNFGDTTGSTGYGIRDNAGTVECKNSGGSWAACGAGGGGLWSDSGAGYIEYNDSLGGARMGAITGQPAPKTGTAVAGAAAPKSASGNPQLETDASACGVSNEGAMRWDSTNKVPQVCNGTSWVNI